VRVITGSARGRKLVAPRGLAIRPTTDKVKGAIFSMLAAQALREEAAGTEDPFPYPAVLDLYAGTGALGIEALSRGSRHVDFVESDGRARSAVEENLRRTGLASRASIHATRAQTVVSTFRSPYDLILLDPPYDDPSAFTVLEILGESALVGEGTTVILEHARSRSVPARAGKLDLLRTRYHGTTAVSLYRAVGGSRNEE
jgi:16S rRNA (guanine966-N2)-methyltransferase